MKKYLAIAILIVLTGCNQTQMKYGQGGKNACLFVKEQVPELREDISSVEVIGEDSMICDIGLMFGFNRVHEAEMMYYDSKITRSELDQVLDSMNLELTFVENSWKYGTPETYGNKFDGQWRKVYTVRVTMKSGVTKEPRVLMEQDGITPRMIEREFEKKLQNYASELMDVHRRLIDGL